MCICLLNYINALHIFNKSSLPRQVKGSCNPPPPSFFSQHKKKNTNETPKKEKKKKKDLQEPFSRQGREEGLLKLCNALKKINK